MALIHFYALTKLQRPGLDVWHKDRPTRNQLARVKGVALDGRPGWWHFEVELPRSIPLDLKLLEWHQSGATVANWEPDVFKRSLTMTPGAELPSQVWMVEGGNRVLLRDPFVAPPSQVRIHLITAKKYRKGQLFAWTPLETGQYFALPDNQDEDGWPYLDLKLPVNFQTVFNFKFISPDGQYEADFANRTWSAADGAEIWTHSDANALLMSRPQKKQLTVNFRHEWQQTTPVWLHLWQESADYQESIAVDPVGGGEWCKCVKSGLYTGIPYGFMFTSNLGNDPNAWEAPEARRSITLTDNAEFWTLEGDNTLFRSQPQPNQPIVVTVTNRDPQLPWTQPDKIEIRLNQARAVLSQPRYERRPDGSWVFWTYPQIITSFRFGAGDQMEPVYHRIKPPETVDPQKEPRVAVVLGRWPCLSSAVPADLFQDPPYLITRPGVVEEEGYLRFALHAPWCARVNLTGDWLAAGAPPLDLRSTRDGAYWWTQLPVAEIQKALPAKFNQDYHGARYQFILNDPGDDPVNNSLNSAKTVQDPAAAWVETSLPSGFSKLVNQRRYVWQSGNWQTPGPEYLMVYQIHPARFSRRAGDLAPLAQVTREIESGYLRDLGITALLLMPVSEYSGDHGWGYNPSYYYAVEQAYGEPDDLKQLVDTCHQHGIAVLLDVVFNHVGCDHNILWEVARASFCYGDTIWGTMPDFRHPQVRHFFNQNLLYWRQEFHVDGFRFDHTKTIIENANPSYFSIRNPSTGGGWEFLNELRQTVKSLDPRCLFMAEQLPNDWALTNYGGSMDTQWSDPFHDRTVDMCKGFKDKASEYAEALKLSQTSCQQWYNLTDYSESHDEVGNVNDRLANVGGYGKGLRRNKVAAAATMLSRGIPLFFMGEEVGESGQFYFDSTQPLDLGRYESDINYRRVRDWWKTLISLRRHNNSIQGPAPLDVHYVEDLILAFSRGEGQDYYVVVNFGDGPVSRNLGQMNLPEGTYRELWNSTWPAFQVEFEDEHTNGGREAWLNRGSQLQIPDYGAIVLEKRS